VSAAAFSLALLAACNQNTSQVQAPLPRVDVVTAEVIDFAPRATLTGTIAAQVQNDLSFRLSGKIIERNVDVGDHVTADQVLARLDPRTQQADVDSAKAGVTSAQAQLKQAAATFDRQKSLLDSGRRRRCRSTPHKPCRARSLSAPRTTSSRSRTCKQSQQ
jgi:multidrug efflux pump subunit AcrA (membrane-fusion protein)